MAEKQTIIYVTREIERALGATPNEHYHIVSNRTAYGETIKAQYPDHVTLIEPRPDGTTLGSGDLLAHPETAKLYTALMEKAGAARENIYFLLFKNTARIEPLARERGWRLLNPAAAVAEHIENKISQLSWLGDLEGYLPPHRLLFMKNITWAGEPFIVQWAHGHTGGGTILIDNAETLAALKAKFPERRARLTRFVVGPSFTVNVVVTPEVVAMSSVSYQITGLPPFTDSRFTTIGNDWGVVSSLLTPAELDNVRGLVRELGARMQKDCWRGLFGVDFIKDAASNRLYLIEINARQPASTTFESKLQLEQRAAGVPGMTTFEAHLAALLGENLSGPIIPILQGAQVIMRVPANNQIKLDVTRVNKLLREAGLETVNYDNHKPHEDLLRVQSRRSLMRGHEAWNEIGETIINACREPLDK